MKLSEIRVMPTTLSMESTGGGRWHESMLRSYHIVAKVIELLEAGAPASVVIEVIRDLQEARPQEPD